MSTAEESDSPVITTSQWVDVFKDLDQWEVVPKIFDMHLSANASTSATGLSRLCSPNVAYLMVDPQGAVQLLHHFHHDVDDGLNGGTNELWALQGGSSMAHTVAIRPSHLQHKQMEHRIGWMTMLAWNSTDNILDEVNRRVKSHMRKVDQGRRSPAPSRGVKAPTAAKAPRQKTTATRGRGRKTEQTNDDAEEDDEDEVETAGPLYAPLVPIPAFIAHTLLGEYESNPIALCWQAVNEIRKRAAADEDDERSAQLAEIASYVPRWLFSTAVNIRLPNERIDQFGVDNRVARHTRADAWSQAIHRRYLTVRARSVFKMDEAARTDSGADECS